jgi:hypothetical protein
MYNVEKIKCHYDNHPPRLSFGGSEGLSVKGTVFLKFPEEEFYRNSNGITVLHSKIEATNPSLSVDGYCLVEACLQIGGKEIPDALPFFPEMEGHSISVIVFVDWFERIRMRAIGGFTTYKNRAALRIASS